MPDFINEFLEFTKPMESPESFFLWASFSCVGALLRDNVYLSYGTQKLFPNTYILLLADPAGSRKSVPLGIVANIINQVKNTKIIRGRTTIAGILQDLSTPNMDPKSGLNITGGSCILLAEELASFFVQDMETIPRLTDLYDARSEWTDNLRSGKMHIKNLCLSLLAASNEEYLKSVYTKAAVFGGLLRRTFFVRPTARKPPNPLFGITGEQYSDANLVSIARQISQLKGEIQGDSGAIRKYRTWYEKLYASYGRNQDRSGIVESMHTSVLKIGLIIAIARTQELVLKWEHIEEAIDRCIELIPNYGAYSMASGQSDNALIGSIFFTELWDDKEHVITRKLFLRKYWNEVDGDKLDRFISTIEQAGLIQSDMSNFDIVYRLTQAGKEKLEGQLGKDKNAKGSSQQ